MRAFLRMENGDGGTHTPGKPITQLIIKQIILNILIFDFSEVENLSIAIEKSFKQMREMFLNLMVQMHQIFVKITYFKLELYSTKKTRKNKHIKQKRTEKNKN